MAIDYETLENRMFEILLGYLPENKYVDLEDSSLIDQLGSNRLSVNYHPDEPIWFCRIKRTNNFEINYYFGLKDENEVKLNLKFSKDKSSSSLVFLNRKIAVKIKFTKEGAKIFNSMKEILQIRNPSSKEVKYNYIMLILHDESEIIPEIANLIKFIDFGYGRENLLIKGFNENMWEEYLNDRASSARSPAKDDFEEESKSNGSAEASDENIIQKESELNRKRFVPQFENYEFSIERIISEIDCTNFNGESFEDDRLIEKFEEHINSLIFGFVSEGLDDEESSKLVIYIREDISNEKISGNVIDITEFYFDEYRSIKKRFSLNNFLNDYLKSDDFDKLLDVYDDYTEGMIFGIINHVRRDISEDDSMDEDTVIMKVRYYFKAEANKSDYFNQIDEIRANSEHYKNSYNLTAEEFDGILNYIQMKISEGYHIRNVNECLMNKIKEQVDLNRKESRLKLKKLLSNPDFIEKNNISSEELSKISESVGDLIYKNKIRSEIIHESYLLALRDVL